MRTPNRIAGSLLVLAAMLCVALPIAHAQVDAADGDLWPNCTARWLISEQHHMGAHFSVRVAFGGQPIAGAKVSIVSEDPLPYDPARRVIATRKTDADGVAHFFAIPSGAYQAHVDEGLLAPSEEIVVEAGGATGQEVAIEWPSSPIVTQSVRGIVTSWQKDSPQNRSRLLPLKNVLIQLLDLRTGKVLAGTHTGDDGYYEFPGFGDGLYVVRVNDTQDPSPNSNDEAVEVAASAPKEQMPGLEWEKVCGRVLVELQDAARKEVALTGTTMQPK